jgi:TldD protein
VLRDLVAQLERKSAYASAFVVRRRQLGIMSTPREERVGETGPTAGAVFTAWNGSRFEEVDTGDLSRDGLTAAAEQLVARLETGAERGLSVLAEGELPGGQPSHTQGGMVLLLGKPGTLAYETAMKTDPDAVSLEEKLDLCRRTRDRAAKLDPRVVEAQAHYREEHVYSVFVNRVTEMAQKICRVSYGFYDVFSEGGVVRADGEGNGGTGGFELGVLEESKWDEVARRIPGLLKATPIEPGYYDVIVHPGPAGLIAHEAFGHGVETDMFLKGRARSREYVGKTVGSELVNLFDDSTYPGGYCTFGFDDEGQPALKTQILRNGVFIQGLTDLNSAMRLGIPRTANGRRQDTNKAYPRMTNTYFGPGKDSLEDMIASIEHGIYLGQAESGMEDPKDWGVQCVMAWGRAIDGGKFSGRYHTHIGLTGYVPDLLQSVSMAGNDLRLFGGHCGKGHKEMIRVGMGGPHLKMKARLG